MNQLFSIDHFLDPSWVMGTLKIVQLKQKKWMRSRAHTHQQYPLLHLFLPSCPLVLCSILTSPPSFRPSTFPTLRLLRHSELSSSSISRFPFVTHFLLLISPSSLSFHPIRFPPACLPHSASPVFFTWVSSTRSSYIPEMPVTYGPHSSWSAVRPRSFCCRPCRHQRRCWEWYRNASPLIIVTVPAALQIKILTKSFNLCQAAIL